MLKRHRNGLHVFCIKELIGDSQIVTIQNEASRQKRVNFEIRRDRLNINGLTSILLDYRGRSDGQ